MAEIHKTDIGVDLEVLLRNNTEITLVANYILSLTTTNESTLSFK